MRYECTWCSDLIRSDESEPLLAVSYGICAGCMGGERDASRVDNVTHLDRSSADSLPFGLIVLDENGVVVGYNQAECDLSGLDRSDVMGKAFFLEVAPCTSVTNFRGRFEALVDGGVSARARFAFTFRFSEGDKPVDVSMAFDPDTRVTAVLVALGDG